jgi:phosphoadenosine phosphosulfate reductase
MIYMDFKSTFRNHDPDLEALNLRLAGAPPAAILATAMELFAPALTFACSLGLEDLVLLDLVAAMAPRPEVFTLDTGRLPEATYATLAAVRARYDLPIRVFFPQTEAVQALLSAKGPNSFYESLENRLECCRIRKVEPLGRALAGKAAWITGLRQQQSPGRRGLAVFEPDPGNGLVKVNPLAEWSLDQVWAYVHAHQLPFNPLQAEGYPTLGCAPCTRAIRPGEDPRAGRWWWERDGAKECGLHRREPR